MNSQVDYSKRTIGNLVAEDYRKARVFQKYGIDFCCGGERVLSLACQKKNIDSKVVISELAKLDNCSIAPDENYNQWEPDMLTDHIVKTHHTFVRNKIPEINTYSTKVARVHGERHPEVVEIAFIFDMLSNELSEHLEKEENMLFPYINYLARTKINGMPSEKPVFGSVENPIHMMETEHDEAGKELAKIDELSNHYIPPEDACTTFRILYQNLKAFEEDLHKHIHLENNILFPKAMELEKASQKDICAIP